jgi:hypothetical protein
LGKSIKTAAATAGDSSLRVFRDIGRAFVRQQDHERGRLGGLIGLERSLSFDVVH